MEIKTYGDKDADIILIQPSDDHDLSVIDSEISLIRQNIETPFCLYLCIIDNWNNDLSPWTADPVFGKEPFGNNAKETLSFIKENIIDYNSNKKIIMGGYSLAGLFSLWSAYQIGFDAVVSASGSMWFKDFITYAKSNPVRTDNIYLSLGDKEARTKNPVMATVEDKTRELYDYYSDTLKLNTIFELNNGNHFVDSDIRMAKGFIWAIQSIKKDKD